MLQSVHHGSCYWSVSRKVSTVFLDKHLQRLHDKATRGMTLSAGEQTQLAAWLLSRTNEKARYLSS